jgi:hypothetical protein
MSPSCCWITGLSHLLVPVVLAIRDPGASCCIIWPIGGERMWDVRIERLGEASQCLGAAASSPGNGTWVGWRENCVHT